MVPLVVDSPSVASSTLEANKTFPPWVVMVVADELLINVFDNMERLLAFVPVTLALKVILPARMVRGLAIK